MVGLFWDLQEKFSAVESHDWLVFFQWLRFQEGPQDYCLLRQLRAESEWRSSVADLRVHSTSKSKEKELAVTSPHRKRWRQRKICLSVEKSIIKELPTIRCIIIPRINCKLRLVLARNYGTSNYIKTMYRIFCAVFCFVLLYDDCCVFQAIRSYIYKT